MVERRIFLFGTFSGFWASLLTHFGYRRPWVLNAEEFREVRGISGLRYDGLPGKRDLHGNRMARVYCRQPNGTYLEIEPHEVKGGDEILTLGIDGKQVWQVTAAHVHERGAYREEDGREGYCLGAYHIDLLDEVKKQPHPDQLRKQVL